MKTIKDIYGSVEIPDDARWGVNTQRSLQNFPIGVEKMPKELIQALLELKRACAQANKSAHKMEAKKANAIMKAIDGLLDKDFMQDFPLSIWQTGSGTQTNMNANEVIALAVTKMTIHPNDDVNQGQSSNDVFPTAMHIMAATMIENDLIPTMEYVKDILGSMRVHGESILKTGRTHLQDATPISWAQEVSAWETMMTQGIAQLRDALKYLNQLTMGATAVGTGLNSYEGFGQDVCKALNKRLGTKFVDADNKFHAMSSKDAYVFGHGVLNTIAGNILKMINDLRWLASGPRAGLQEIRLPANEAGSSIMPGKVNPTQIEALSMVCVQVMGNNTAISIGGSQGNFQLNTYMPMMAYNFWQSVKLLTEGLDSFALRCLEGIEVNEDVMHHNLTHSLMSATIMNPVLGYDTVAKLVKMAHTEGLGIREVVVREGYMSAEEFDETFDYQEMIRAKKK